LVRWGVYESAKKYVGWPITPGFEFAGRVVKKGRDVTRFKEGDAVFGITRFNAYATHVAVPEHQLFLKPDQLSFEEAAGFPAVHLTAYHCLFQVGRLYPKSRILVHSAAGGVGTALCQLARRAGFHTIGVVGSAHKIDVAKNFGANEVVVRDEAGKFWEELRAKNPEGYDAVYDAQGPESYRKSFDLLGSSGKLFVYGAHGLMPKKGGRINWLSLIWKSLKGTNFKPFELITLNRSVCGFNVSFLFDKGEMIHEGVDNLVAALKEGTLQPPPVKTFSFDEVVSAHQLIESGLSVGKIVLVNPK
jgi:synaptic vesicle membrane protein VAT-1